MKSLCISILCLALLMTVWGIYDSYSDRTLKVYIDTIEEIVLPAVEEENWAEATETFDEISRGWHEYKKVSAFFFDRSLLNESDYSIAKTKYFIRANDVSNASGELACLKEQLTFLHKNESFHIENVL